ncbi:HNH endonuclease [Vibrio coralliirubri]|uniref:HNH endonuclease n=1 Tax=Vibrio coralliirubri TaxID=1516159 RepID=UPI000B362F94|nr:HNH endonuclease [Vibrio coralliirubri]
MFSVDRPEEAPEGLSKGHDSKDVVEKLEEIFHGKCYLCEFKDTLQPEVEHFIPQSLDSELAKDWDNLFYSCRRCNSIKSSKPEPLLDCTKEDVFSAILLDLPLRKTRLIEVSVNEGYESERAKNTAALLTLCYNREESGYQKITRSLLRDMLHRYLDKYSEYTSVLLDSESGKREKLRAEDKLERMLQPDFAFHAFWRGIFLDDEKLMKNYNHLLDPE